MGRSIGLDVHRNFAQIRNGVVPGLDAPVRSGSSASAQPLHLEGVLVDDAGQSTTSRASTTIRTARSRKSSGYLTVRRGMTPSNPVWGSPDPSTTPRAIHPRSLSPCWNTNHDLIHDGQMPPVEFCLGGASSSRSPSRWNLHLCNLLHSRAARTINPPLGKTRIRVPPFQIDPNLMFNQTHRTYVLPTVHQNWPT